MVSLQVINDLPGLVVLVYKQTYKQTKGKRKTHIEYYEITHTCARTRTHTHKHTNIRKHTHSFIHSGHSIAPLQVRDYSEALTTQDGYCVRVSREAPQAIASEGLAQD